MSAFTGPFNWATDSSTTGTSRVITSDTSTSGALGCVLASSVLQPTSGAAMSSMLDIAMQRAFASRMRESFPIWKAKQCSCLVGIDSLPDAKNPGVVRGSSGTDRQFCFDGQSLGDGRPVSN